MSSVNIDNPQDGVTSSKDKSHVISKGSTYTVYMQAPKLWPALLLTMSGQSLIWLEDLEERMFVTYSDIRNGWAKCAQDSVPTQCSGKNVGKWETMENTLRPMSPFTPDPSHAKDVDALGWGVPQPG